MLVFYFHVIKKSLIKRNKLGVTYTARAVVKKIPDLFHVNVKQHTCFWDRVLATL